MLDEQFDEIIESIAEHIELVVPKEMEVQNIGLKFTEEEELKNELEEILG